MKRWLLYSLIFIAIIITIFIVLISCSNKVEARIIESESHFYNFYEEDNRVYIECGITIENLSEDNMSFMLYATMFEEVRFGLLKEPIAYALDDALNKQIYSIGGNEKAGYSVTFVGDYNGTFKKLDRNIPKRITIEKIEVLQ